MSEYQKEIGIILFGVGNNVTKYESLLQIMRIPIVAYVDNDSAKWGLVHRGSRINPPTFLIYTNNRILISSSYTKEITEQLEMMNLTERIIDIPELLEPSCGYEAIIDKRKRTIIIDGFEGIGWGGMEMWSYLVAKGLNENDMSAIVIGKENQIKPDEEYEQYIKRILMSNSDDVEIIKKIYMEMESHLPILVVDNWTNHVHLAACLLKKKYPNLVHIISVQHNDSDIVYREKIRWKSCFEKIVAVSHVIADNLNMAYKVEKMQIAFKENFCIPMPEVKRAVRKAEMPLKIAWGGRLEKVQKRAELLPVLISALEQSNMDYELEIAGDGSFREELEQFIENNGLGEKIIMRGFIFPKDMRDFWLQQHVYINLSDYEGSSLAMIEAMSCGCVPVVTDVSGADEFVGETVGFRIKNDTINNMVDKILFLYQNESLRQIYSHNASIIIREKCNYIQYIRFIKDICSEVINSVGEE